MEENKKVILLIGSAPFGGDPTNPTYELAKLLNGTVYKDYVFRSASFPVSRRQCIPAVEAAIAAWSGTLPPRPPALGMGPTGTGSLSVGKS